MTPGRGHRAGLFCAAGTARVPSGRPAPCFFPVICRRGGYKVGPWATDEAPEVVMSPVSRRFVLTGTALDVPRAAVASPASSCGRRARNAGTRIRLRNHRLDRDRGERRGQRSVSQPEVGQARTPRCRRSSPTSSTPIGRASRSQEAMSLPGLRSPPCPRMRCGAARCTADAGPFQASNPSVVCNASSRFASRRGQWPWYNDNHVTGREDNS